MTTVRVLSQSGNKLYRSDFLALKMIATSHLQIIIPCKLHMKIVFRGFCCFTFYRLYEVGVFTIFPWTSVRRDRLISANWASSSLETELINNRSISQRRDYCTSCRGRSSVPGSFNSSPRSVSSSYNCVQHKYPFHCWPLQNVLLPLQSPLGACTIACSPTCCRSHGESIYFIQERSNFRENDSGFKITWWRENADGQKAAKLAVTSAGSSRYKKYSPLKLVDIKHRNIDYTGRCLLHNGGKVPRKKKGFTNKNRSKTSQAAMLCRDWRWRMNPAPSKTSWHHALSGEICTTTKTVHTSSRLAHTTSLPPQ